MYAASVTKQLVATLAALAVRRGVLGYDDSVVAHLPDLPAWVRPVRVRHLIHHTSDLPEVTGHPGHSPGEPDNGAVLDRLRSGAPRATGPGRAFAYSNTGYVLLAEVVSAASGEPMEELARRSVFEPLELSDSTLGGAPPVLVAGRPEPPRTVGDGGWWTSAADLNRWLVALNTSGSGEGPFDRDMMTTLETPGRLDDGTPLDYAWGAGVRRYPHQGDDPLGPPRRTLTHGGSWPGWLARTLRQPDQGFSVALLTASDDEALVSELAGELAQRC